MPNPIDRVADELFMHDLASRVNKQFGAPAALELAVILTRIVANNIRARSESLPNAAVTITHFEHAIMGLFESMAKFGDDADRQAIEAAKNPPMKERST